MRRWNITGFKIDTKAATAAIPWISNGPNLSSERPACLCKTGICPIEHRTSFLHNESALKCKYKKYKERQKFMSFWSRTENQFRV